MEVIRGNSIKSENEEVVVALGTFDGIHYGHQQILNEAIKSADELGCKSALFSFTPHPLSVVTPKKAPFLITSWEQKFKILEELGIDKVFLEEFTNEFSKLHFEDFVKDYLVEGINAKKIIVGKDFRFGYKGLGNVGRLKKLGKKFNFEVEVLVPVKIDKQVVSSTYIRNLIKKGQIGDVKKYLSRNYFLEGQVINGDQRGRELGFPTANLKPVTNYVIPKTGVYAIYAHIGDERLQGIAHLGPRPTFNKHEFTIEVHIFDFTGNLYQQEIEVEFIKRLRGELCFKDEIALISQIENDIRKAKELLTKNRN
ncbi:bifunctional riboflavin kinase/FAD synthetase [Selenihalanaerobacter shriftii]|uniref:Riboflavin biosynthesis protein n=1 Tax=Selenihalanaerobacter shriftii TaxID=142842 RepID=A0A1T4JNJ7_9FIRM|nr:bifunctional riboflavin kinase/FAD synthetase [Selenihalanaerobacter shriftii]SJZ31740.1 riboflavin kinase / FMN adenylyltransferase [Selenihalanaerobacter shriftii]